MQNPPSYGNAFPPAQPPPSGFGQPPAFGQPPGGGAFGSPPGGGAFGPPPAAPAGPPKKKTNWALYVGIGCLGLVTVCCVLPIGGFFVGNASAKGDAEDAIGDFAEAGRARDATRVLAMFDSYARSSADPAQMPTAMAGCPGLTTNTSFTLDEFNIDHPLDDFVLARVTYQTPTGPIEASIGLERESDGYQIATYNEYGPHLNYGDCDLPPRRAYGGYPY